MKPQLLLQLRNNLIAIAIIGLFCLLTQIIPQVAYAAGPAPPADPRNICADGSYSFNDSLEGNCIVRDINLIVRILSAGVGIVIVISLIVAGIRYISAGSDPNAVNAAKKRIYNGIFALLAFLFMMAFLEWLIPGNLFTT